MQIGLILSCLGPFYFGATAYLASSKLIELIMMAKNIIVFNTYIKII